MWRNEPTDDEDFPASEDEEPTLAVDDESDVEAHGSWAGAPLDAPPAA